jgi:hypothetical protein
MEAEALSNAPGSDQRVMLESVSMHTSHALLIRGRDDVITFGLGQWCLSMNVVGTWMREIIIG